MGNIAGCCEAKDDLRPGASTQSHTLQRQDEGEKPIRIEYFGNGYGRVDPIRQMLVHKEVDFQYVAHTPESFAALKENGGNIGEAGVLPR